LGNIIIFIKTINYTCL